MKETIVRHMQENVGRYSKKAFGVPASEQCYLIPLRQCYKCKVILALLLGSDVRMIGCYILHLYEGKASIPVELTMQRYCKHF